MAGSSKQKMPLLTPEEIKRIFNLRDVNKDKNISVTDLIAGMKAIGSELSDEEAKKLMEEIDTDHDGFINLEEFTKHCLVEHDDTDEGFDSMRKTFDVYDEDKDGFISATELHHTLSKIMGANYTLQECSNMIKSVDSDGDGFISFEEFKTMMTGFI